MSETGEAVVNRPNLDLTTEVESRDEFSANRALQTTGVDWSDEAWEGIADRLAKSAADFKQGSFYPLVANLFTAAGHPAWRPPTGDTSNRIDLILVSDVDSLPVEVKSRTESTAINVKSVQQALENRVVLDQRQFLPADPASSTLVVGFEYPASRSDVGELVDDIARAFGVNVGLISLPDLYGIALRWQIAEVETPRSALNQLRGRLS